MSKHSGHAKQEILASAERCFAEAGFAGTSVQEIIAGTHYSKPTLYYYFRSKEGLLRALLDLAYDECHARMEKAAALSTRVGEALTEILVVHFEFLRERKELIRLAFAAAFAAPREIPEGCRDRARWQRNFDFVEQLMKKGMAQGEFKGGCTSKELARAFFGALSYYLMVHVLQHGVALNRRTARRVMSLFLEGAGK